MIDQSWLTQAEREVLGAALDHYIGEKNRRLETAIDDNMRAILKWRRYIAIELRHQIPPR